MDISGTKFNQSIGFYPQNTGKNINYPFDDEIGYNTVSNVFVSDNVRKKIQGKDLTSKIKKRKSKRLNTIDTEYLPDESIDYARQEISERENFFLEEEKISVRKKIKQTADFLFSKVPLINYLFLKNKKNNIKKTVEKLNNINQNVDELLNSAVPYGEEEKLYDDITVNLINAAGILGETSRRYKKS